jgi:hypothetical protein
MRTGEIGRGCVRTLDQANLLANSTIQNGRYGVFAARGMVKRPLETRGLRVFTQSGPKPDFRHNVVTIPNGRVLLLAQHGAIVHEIIFKSADFPVLPHEDEEINPGILGRSVADWITKCLSGTKFAITEDINEDFGYCLMVHRKPYWLWVGCSGSTDHAYDEDGLDEIVAASIPLESIEWRIWVSAEWGLLSRLLGRDQRSADKSELSDLLKAKLAELPTVAFE